MSESPRSKPKQHQLRIRDLELFSSKVNLELNINIE